MRKRAVTLLLLAIACAALVAASRGVADFSRRQHKLEILYLPSGQFVEQASLGYRNLAADLLWFRMIQYYGGYRLGQNDLAYFTHLVNVITDLDPQFTFAYVFGALIIAEDVGDFERGIGFIEKGIAANPRDWRLPFELGFLQYVYARDYEAALRGFQRAAALPGAEPIVQRLAAFAAGKAGHVETSMAMWEELARSSDNKYIRELAERYIRKLKAGTFDAPGAPEAADGERGGLR